MTASYALDGIDLLVRAAAGGLTRRRLLRRAGQGALGAALGTALLWKEPGLAEAGQIACPGPPLCRSTRCSDSTGQCHDSSRTRPMRYLQGFCASSGTLCWTEPHGCLWVCCDCCVDYQTGGGASGCTGCGQVMWPCVCRKSFC